MDEQLNAALAAMDRSDYEAALNLLRPLAEAGNRRAQNSLGVLFQLGLGVERNLVEALHWFKLAAQQGEGMAAHNIGTIYLTGAPEIPMDRDESKRWFRRARALGFQPTDPPWYE